MPQYKTLHHRTPEQDSFDTVASNRQEHSLMIACWVLSQIKKRVFIFDYAPLSLMDLY